MSSSQDDTQSYEPWASPRRRPGGLLARAAQGEPKVRPMSRPLSRRSTSPHSHSDTMTLHEASSHFSRAMRSAIAFVAPQPTP